MLLLIIIINNNKIYEDKSEEVGHVHVHYLLYGDFHTIVYVYAGREVNAIDSSRIVPVIITSVKI